MPFSVKNDDCKPSQLEEKRKNHNSSEGRKNSIPLYTWHNLHFKKDTILTLTVHCILIKAKDLKPEGTQSVLQASLHIL